MRRTTVILVFVLFLGIGCGNYIAATSSINTTSQANWTRQPNEISGHVTMSVHKCYGMKDCSPASTPVDAGIKLSRVMKADSDVGSYMQIVPYRSAVGSLMYLLVAPRLDIAAAVGLVCRYTNQSCSQHWTAVKRILRYLKGTATWCLNLSADSYMQLRGYCDADWANHRMLSHRLYLRHW